MECRRLPEVVRRAVQRSAATRWKKNFPGYSPGHVIIGDPMICHPPDDSDPPPLYPGALAVDSSQLFPDARGYGLTSDEMVNAWQNKRLMNV